MIWTRRKQVTLWLLTQLVAKYNLNALVTTQTNPLFPGATLALSTRASENRHVLRLYDVNRQNPAAHTAINLETFPVRYEDFEGEVNCTTFSPDGVYLAVARNDNFLHVYDSRMLTRGPLFEYEHFGESKAPSQTSTFGVVKTQWVHSEHTRRIALVTAGEDGMSMVLSLYKPFRSPRPILTDLPLILQAVFVYGIL